MIEGDDQGTEGLAICAIFCYHRVMNVSLTAELERFIEEEVKSGDYQTNSEVVREALRQMKRRKEMVEDIRVKLAQAEADIQAGRVIPGEQILESVNKEVERRRKQKV